MNNTAQQQQQPSQAVPTQPQVVQAKISYAPLIITTLIGTVVTIGVGYAFSKYTENKREEEEDKKMREREERSAMMPPMPMMWPGSTGGAMPNPGMGMGPAPAAGPAAGPSAAPVMGPAQATDGATQTQLNDIVDRLGEWQDNLDAREQRLGLVG